MAATATKVKSLDLTDVKAKKVVKLGMEHGAYSDDMPDTKAGRLEAALEVVNFCIDSWVNDGVRPDDDDEEFAAAGEAIVKILEAAGIGINKKGDIELPEEDDEDEDDNEEDDEEESEEEDDEAPFDPDDYVEGYSEMTYKAKLAALGELDLEDEDTAGVVGAIHEWENGQEKPSARVMNWIEENVEGIGGDNEDDEDEDDDDDEEETESEEEGGQPWTKESGFAKDYDKSTAAEIRKELDGLFKSGDLTVDQVEYVKSYENGRDKPPTRANVIKKCDELIEKLSEEDEKPKGALAKKKSGAGTTAKKALGGKKEKDEEDGEQVQISVNEGDAIVLDANNLYNFFAQIAEALEAGATSIEITTG